MGGFSVVTVIPGVGVVLPLPYAHATRRKGHQPPRQIQQGSAVWDGGSCEQAPDSTIRRNLCLEGSITPLIGEVSMNNELVLWQIRCLRIWTWVGAAMLVCMGAALAMGIFTGFAHANRPRATFQDISTQLGGTESSFADIKAELE
jgi:hypothetical protein